MEGGTGSFGWATDSGLLLELGQFIDDLVLELHPEVVGLLKIDLPLLPSKRIVLEPRALLVIPLARGLGEVLLDLLLHPIPEGEILHQQILIHGHLLQDLLHLRLVQEIHLRALGLHVVDLVDLLLQLRQLDLALQHQHDLQAVALGWRQEDHALEITDVPGVVGEVGVELEIEVYV